MIDKPPPSVGLKAGLSLLGDPQFARLFWGRLVSTLGSGMAPVAIAFAVLDLTGSAAWVGRVLAAQTGAMVLVQLFAGALADRMPRARLMVGADLLATASQTAVAVLLLTGLAGPWHLLGFEAVNGIAFALFFPASVGLVPQVVRRDQLQPANALLSIAQSGATALGAAIAGIIVALLGAGWAIGIDALTFLASAIVLAGIRPVARMREVTASLLAEIRGGWEEFTSHTWL